MTDPCARWMELSDKQLVGEELSKLELELVRLHELDCEQCGREAALFRELRTAPLHLVPSEEEVRRILLQAELNEGDEPWSAEHPKLGSRFSTPRVAAVASVLALAACLWLYLRTAGDSRTLPAGPTAALNSSNGSRRASPLPGGRTETKTPLAAPAPEDSCSSVVDGIVLCLVAGSEVGEIHTEGPRRTVELRRGRAVASLEPQAAGTSFSITTAAGTVTAVGTIFSVEIGHEGEVYASVTRGKVLVEGLGGVSAFSLTAGQMVRLGDTEVSALPALEAQQDLDLVARWPAAITDRRGEARAPFERAEAQPPDGRSAANAGPQAQVRDELSYARALRMEGQFARAAAVYRSIYSRSPRTEGGRAALLSLASLQLSSLGDASGALASYESYLAGGGGPLSEQAEYGRIRALHQLGHASQEREATRKFIARYPNAPETRLLKKRDGVPGRP
jgi:FecR protein